MRRLLLFALTTWVAGATVVSAAAPAELRHQRHVSSITLTPHGDGTVIRITYAGRLRRVVRVIESRDSIDALALTDIDNDGDLDILASARGGTLVMWRNAGHGRFRLATVPPRRAASTSVSRVGRCHHADAPIQAGDDRYGAAMPRAPVSAAADPTLAQFLVRFLWAPVPARQRPSGRAPPTQA
jgi:hypothetical protein